MTFRVQIRNVRDICFKNDLSLYFDVDAKSSYRVSTNNSFSSP